MKGTTILWLGAAAVIGYKAVGVAKLANAGDRLKVDPLRVGFTGASKGILNFKLYMDGTNPSGTELKIDGIYLNLSLPGAGKMARIAAGTAELGGGLKLKENAVTNFAIPFQVTLVSLVLTAGSAAVTAITTGKLPKELLIDGEIKVNGIPITYDQHVPLKKEVAGA